MGTQLYILQAVRAFYRSSDCLVLDDQERDFEKFVAKELTFVISELIGNHVLRSESLACLNAIVEDSSTVDVAQQCLLYVFTTQTDDNFCTNIADVIMDSQTQLNDTFSLVKRVDDDCIPQHGVRQSAASASRYISLRCVPRVRTLWTIDIDLGYC